MQKSVAFHMAPPGCRWYRRTRRTDSLRILKTRRGSYEKGTGFYIYRSGQPWAVDLIKDKKPIITIEVNTKISSFFILNGYIDFDKQSLFYNNSRAKTIQILDKETNTIIGNYQLPDKVIYQLIYLPKAVKYFQIISIDTYPGLKYSDLCISSIYLNTENEKVISGDYGISFLNELKKEKKF